MIRSTLILLFVGYCLTTYSQDKNAIVQQRIEFISEQLESEDVDLTDVIEVLYYRLEHPLNLNNATKESLRELNLLTDVQMSDFLLHRERFGKLISIYELQSLKYWDMETILLVRPFIHIDDRLDQLHVSFKEAIKRGNFEWYARYQRIFEQKKGYTASSPEQLSTSNSYYHGNPDRYYTRFRYSYRTNLSFGITGEKDPGEQFFKGTQKNGFDFYSIHAFYKGGKYLKAIAIGDYQVQIGQGLNLWSGYAFGKTADAVNIKKNANSLKPYTSVDEMRFMRGAAIDLGYKDFELSLFGSVKKVDGAVQYTDSVTTDDLDFEVGNEYVSSINMTGFHRTNSEILRKGSLMETIYGGNLRYERRNLHVGIAGVNWHYNKEYSKPVLPYNQFDFRGRNTTSVSADYSYVIRNFHFFGEASYVTHSKSWATIHGVLFALDSRATMTLLYRNYQRGYETFYNAAFAESGRMAKNERGVYAGLSVNITKAWTLNTYFDLFEFPWLKYQVDRPSHGHEFLIQPTYRPSRNLEIYTRFRQQFRQQNSRNTDGSVTELEDVIQRNYRINITYKISTDFTIKSRVEYLTINRMSSKAEDGILFTQDLLYKPKKLPFDITLRYALFDTDSYDSRMYTFEANALYVFSIPAYYYQGSRVYTLVRLTLFRKVDLWVRYGVFLYNNRKTLGAGSEMINANQKTDLTIQLRLKL
jgi:hypothetical protein